MLRLSSAGGRGASAPGTESRARLTVPGHKRGATFGAWPATQVDPAVRELSATLLPRADELAVGMADRIRAEVPLYAEGELVIREELNASCADNLRYTGQPGRAAVVRA